MSDGEIPIGSILDGLGLTAPISEAEQVVQVLVIAKTVNLETGKPALIISSNDLDWIEQAGLHSAANQIFMANEPVFGGED